MYINWFFTIRPDSTLISPCPDSNFQSREWTMGRAWIFEKWWDPDRATESPNTPDPYSNAKSKEKDTSRKYVRVHFNIIKFWFNVLSWFNLLWKYDSGHMTSWVWSMQAIRKAHVSVETKGQWTVLCIKCIGRNAAESSPLWKMR